MIDRRWSMSQDLYECQLRTPRELYIQKFKKVLVYQSWLLVLIYGPCNQRDDSQMFKKVRVHLQSWLLVYGPCNQRVVCVKVSV